MASLSNINGLFDVHSTGAILFSTSHGTSGQILRSNGNAAPTWVAASTVIGGPYLPLAGGTLTGPTATATGINFTVGGNLFVTSTSTLTGALSATSATFTGNVLLGSNNDIPMDASASGQLMVDGVGYQGAIALDDQAMYIYHNSSGRNLVLGTNETARLTIGGSGNSIFSGTLTVAGGVVMNGNQTVQGNLTVDGTLAGTSATFTGDVTLGNILLTPATIPGANTPSINLHSTNNEIYIQSGSAHIFNFIRYDNRNSMMNIESTGISVTGGGTFTGKVLLNANNINFESSYSGNGLVLSHHGVGPSNAIVSGNSVYPDTLFINNGGTASDWSNVSITGNVGIGTTNPHFNLQITGGNATEETVLKLDKGATSDTGGHTTILGLGTEGGSWAKAGIGFERTGSYDIGNIHFLMYPPGLNTGSVSLSDSVMTIKNNGDVGIGVTLPSEKLQVAGKTIINSTGNYTSNAGSLSVNNATNINGGVVDTHSNGNARYYTRVAHGSTGLGSAGYWHIKTNMLTSQYIMFLAKFYGYIYGQSAVLDLQHTGYAYAGTSVINQGTTNNGTNASASSAVYLTAAQEVCFRIDMSGSTYYAGVWMDISFQNPTGGTHNLLIQATAWSTTVNYYT